MPVKLLLQLKVIAEVSTFTFPCSLHWSEANVCIDASASMRSAASNLQSSIIRMYTACAMQNGTTTHSSVSIDAEFVSKAGIQAKQPL